MKRVEKRGNLLVFGILFMMLMTPVSAFASEGLVSLLTSQLGVTDTQAEGGAGALFRAAKANMKADDFTELSAKVPEASSLIDKAPVVSDKKQGMLAGAASLMGDTGEKINAATEIVESFKQLGLDSDMVEKFTPVVLDYVKEKAGEASMQLLQSALSF
jgi:hypothetical protein